jgi:hypothetical protein
MSVQNKLWACGSHEFWQDIDRSVSFLVRDLITGRDVARIAKALRDNGVERCSDSLLYKWANPEDERLPSSKALLLLIKITENCGPVETINAACGIIGCPDHDYREGIRHFDREFEKRERMRGAQAGTPAPLGPGA